MVRIIVPNASEAAQLAAIDAAAFPERNSEWTAEDYLRFGGTPGATLLSDAEIAEGLLVMMVAGDEGEIINLGVIPAARRKGLARDLLGTAEDLAARYDIRRVFLEVASDNTAARALYAGAGYEERGRRPDYYRRPDGRRVDALILAKSLRA